MSELCQRENISSQQTLHLSYPYMENGSSCEAYDLYFDELDKKENIYDNIKKLYLETDFINKLPESLIKFKNLIDITVVGSRFWDLTCKQIPATVEYVDFTKHSNLNYNVFKNSDHLVKLQHILIDESPFCFDIFMYNNKVQSGENPIPIADTESLMVVEFDYSDSNDICDLIQDWQDVFKTHALMKNIMYRIKNIEYKKSEYNDQLLQSIVIILNKKLI
jgi:hypothetical protein